MDTADGFIYENEYLVVFVASTILQPSKYLGASSTMERLRSIDDSPGSFCVTEKAKKIVNNWETFGYRVDETNADKEFDEIINNDDDDDDDDEASE